MFFCLPCIAEEDVCGKDAQKNATIEDPSPVEANPEISHLGNETWKCAASCFTSLMNCVRVTLINGSRPIENVRL